MTTGKKFGLSLSFTFKNKKNDGTNNDVFAHVLPPLVRNALDYLSARSAATMEGIFRVTGSITDIEAIAKKYEKGKEVPLSTISNPHTVAGLLKHYLRHKQGGLVPEWMRSCFFAAGDIEDEALRVVCVAKALKLLPAPNMFLLMRICEYLHEVQKYSSVNKMTAYNLSLIFGNTFLPACTDNIELAFAQNSHAYAFTETLIKNYHIIFANEGPELHELHDITTIPVGAKAFLDLLDQYSSPPPSDPKNHTNEGYLQTLTNKINKIIGDSEKEMPVAEFKNELLSLQHRNNSNGGFENIKNYLNNKYLDEVTSRGYCELADVELLAEYLRINETELFSSYLNRIVPDPQAKNRVRKAALKMYRDKSRRKTSVNV